MMDYDDDAIQMHLEDALLQALTSLGLPETDARDILSDVAGRERALLRFIRRFHTLPCAFHPYADSLQVTLLGYPWTGPLGTFLAAQDFSDEQVVRVRATLLQGEPYIDGFRGN